MSDQTTILDNERRSFSVLILFRVLTIFCSFRLIFELFRYSVLRQIIKGVPISSEQYLRNERIEFFSWCLQLLVFVATFVALIQWMHRAYGNLLQFEEKTPSVPQNMAIIGWFVPLANFWIPFRILSKTVRGHELILIKEKFLRLSPRRHSTVASWWITWVVASVTHALSFNYPLEETITGVVLMVISLLFYCLSGFWGIRMITDMRIMEKGLSEMKHVATQREGQDDLLDSI